MTGEMMFVFGLLGATIVLFLWDRIRLDIVAFLVILALTLSRRWGHRRRRGWRRGRGLRRELHPMG